MRWCTEHEPLPAAAAAISAYLTTLAGHGAKVGTMSRRLSAIRFAHRLRDLPDPTENARVVAVWEGIRRTHTDPTRAGHTAHATDAVGRPRRLPHHQDLEDHDAAEGAAPGRPA